MTSPAENRPTTGADAKVPEGWLTWAKLQSLLEENLRNSGASLAEDEKCIRMALAPQPKETER